MPRLNLSKFHYTVYRSLASVTAAFVVMVIFLNLPIFFDFLRDAVDAPKFYYVLYAAAILLGLLRIQSAFEFLKTPLCLWSIAFMAVIALNIWRIQTFDVQNGDVAFELDAILPVLLFVAASF